jgi:hypothetical protein
MIHTQPTPTIVLLSSALYLEIRMTTPNNTPASTSTPRLLFSPGQVVATPGALEAMERHNLFSLDLLSRHLCGDWGQVPLEDAEANQQALTDGNRILSSYPLPDGARIWLITEADRSSTTFLLPEEY